MPKFEENMGEQVIFVKPNTSAYQDAYDGKKGLPAESTRMPVTRFLVPSLCLTTDYADHFKPMRLTRRRKESTAFRGGIDSRPSTSTGHDQATPSSSPVRNAGPPAADLPGLVNQSSLPAGEIATASSSSLSESLERGFKEGLGNLADFQGPTSYGDAYISHDPKSMVDLRGRSTYKYAKSHVLPTTLASTVSETKHAYVPILNCKTEKYFIHPSQWASRYSKHHPIPLVVSPEEAATHLVDKYNSKYRKNYSTGLFYGPPCSSRTAYQTCSGLGHTWPPKDFERAAICKVIAKFTVPTQKMAVMSTHRDHYSGKTMKERYAIDIANLPALDKSDATDAKVTAFEDSSRNDFWNCADSLLRKYKNNLEKDENYQEIDSAMRRLQPLVDANLRPMQLHSANRIRTSHVTGVGCSNAISIPFGGETTYHEELRWEEGAVRTAAKPHAGHVDKLMKQYPEALTGLSDYKDNYQDHPPQSRPEMLQRRYPEMVVK